MATHERLKEMTAHIRRRVKATGIRARVRISPSRDALQVFPTAYGAQFSVDEQIQLADIFDANCLKAVRQLPILRNGTRGNGFEHLELSE